MVYIVGGGDRTRTCTSLRANGFLDRGSTNYAYSSIWGDRWNSNPRHAEPQSAALPTELRPHGGEGGIRTLARFYPPNPLAGGPLEPLGYLSKSIYEKTTR